MRKFFREIFTEPNNKTFCPVRVLAVAGTLQFMALAVIHSVKQATFDPQAYAIGFAALIGGVGAALGMKKDTPSDDSKQ